MINRFNAFILTLVLLIGVVSGGRAEAQAPAPAPTAPRPTAQTPAPASTSAAARPAVPAAPVRVAKEGEVESVPIKCWWRADRTAIRVGERFALVLTCGVIEAGNISVAAAVNELEPGAISITPFEAVSGVRREDVVVPPWRYFQFEYSVRLLSVGFFGHDINIPALTVTYNIQAPGGGSQGRDMTYMLPALPMRVLSIVPRTANDIRDASGLTFASVESRRFRASLSQVVAWVFFAFAGVLLALGAVRLFGDLRGRDVKATRPVPMTAVLAHSLGTLTDVKAAANRGGWTPELASRALTALRIGGAHALGKSVAQQFVDAGVAERKGQLTVRTGLIRRRRALVSAATTSQSISSRLERGPAVRARLQTALVQLASALKAFSVAAYARGETFDGPALDAALDEGMQATRQLRMRAAWPMRTLASVARTFTGF